MPRKRGKRVRRPAVKRKPSRKGPAVPAALPQVRGKAATQVRTTVRLMKGGKVVATKRTVSPVVDVGRQARASRPKAKAAPLKRSVPCPTCGREFTPAGLLQHYRAHPDHRPGQTADEAFFQQEMRRAARAGAQLGKEVRAQVLKDERNPLFRQAHDIGEVVRAVDRTKATAAERKRQRFEAAKAARITKRDAGKTVVFDTAGQRYRSFLDVPKGRKVFVVRPDRIGRLRYLNAVDPKTLMRGVRPQVMPQDPRRFDFRRWAALSPKEYGQIAAEMAGRRAQPVWSGQNVTFSTKVEDGDLDGPARKLANVFDEAARSQIGMTQWVGDVLVNVKGEDRPLRITTPVLNVGQFYQLDPEGRGGPKAKRGGKVLAQNVIKYKVRDLVRAELSKRGLVSKASARRVQRMSWNRGRPRSKWTLDPERTKPWKGAGREDVTLGEFQFRLRQIF